MKKAIETLVNSAQQAAVEAGRDVGGAGIGGGKFRIAIEITEEQIAAKERELEQARLQLTRIRKGV